MKAIITNNKEKVNSVDNNKNENNMKRLNLLFIEGNRQKIDQENIKQSYNKILTLGYIPSMPIEYIPMTDIEGKLNEKRLYKATITRKTGNGEAIISNFKINTEIIQPCNYNQYDGICVDGQHRSLALQFSQLNNINPSYTSIDIPKDMDILTYIALRNNGKTWDNADFYNSNISTNNKEMDYILSLCKNYKPAFIFALYTFGTSNLTSGQIKAIQLGYKKPSDFSKLQLNTLTQMIGDRLLETLKNHCFLTEDRFTGRFAQGLKQYYNEVKQDEQKVIDTINLIDKLQWNKHFTPTNGQSMEAKSYV